MAWYLVKDRDNFTRVHIFTIVGFAVATVKTKIISVLN